VLRPGGRLGVSDIIADDGLDPVQRAAAEHAIGCACATLTSTEYEQLLAGAGFTAITVTATHDAGGGLYSAIIKAIRPLASTR
jgi:hypothetical protein